MEDVRKNLGGALSIFAKVLADVTQTNPIVTGNDYPSIFDDLLTFFPIDKVDWNAGTGDQYLSDLHKTVLDNYRSGNYQVSSFYSHLIFMSYVYYCVENAYKLEPKRMVDIYYPINAYNGKNNKPVLENYDSVYSFSKIPEKDIFKVFRIVGMDDEIIKKFSKYIGSRDNFAHATGEGNISEDALKQNVKTIIGNMNAIHKVFFAYLKKNYIVFLQENLFKEYSEIIIKFPDFVFENTMSTYDINLLCHLGVKKLQTRKKLKENYQSTRNIHCAFIEYCIDNYGVSIPEGYPSLRNNAYLHYKYQDKADEYVENELGINAYSYVKDGGEFPVYDCPECDCEQLIHDAETGKWHCFHCGEDFIDSDLAVCDECGRIMREDEFCICEACYRYKMEKD